MPRDSMIITVESQGVGTGPADLAKTLPSVHMIGVSRNKEATRAQLNSMAWTHSKGGPVYREKEPDPWVRRADSLCISDQECTQIGGAYQGCLQNPRGLLGQVAS